MLIGGYESLGLREIFNLQNLLIYTEISVDFSQLTKSVEPVNIKYFIKETYTNHLK